MRPKISKAYTAKLVKFFKTATDVEIDAVYALVWISSRMSREDFDALEIAEHYRKVSLAEQNFKIPIPPEQQQTVKKRATRRSAPGRISTATLSLVTPNKSGATPARKKAAAKSKPDVITIIKNSSKPSTRQADEPSPLLAPLHIEVPASTSNMPCTSVQSDSNSGVLMMCQSPAVPSPPIKKGRKFKSEWIERAPLDTESTQSAPTQQMTPRPSQRPFSGEYTGRMSLGARDSLPEPYQPRPLRDITPTKQSHASGKHQDWPPSCSIPQIAHGSQQPTTVYSHHENLDDDVQFVSIEHRGMRSESNVWNPTTMHNMQPVRTDPVQDEPLDLAKPRAPKMTHDSRATTLDLRYRPSHSDADSTVVDITGDENKDPNKDSPKSSSLRPNGPIIDITSGD